MNKDDPYAMVEAAFTVELARNPALQAAVSLHGRMAVFAIFGIGWLKGMEDHQERVNEMFGKRAA